jgi:hypothetical protein
MICVKRLLTNVGRITDKRNDDFVPGTPASRIRMVWPLTREVASLSKDFNVRQGLQRNVTVLRRRGTSNAHALN